MEYNRWQNYGKKIQLLSSRSVLVSSPTQQLSSAQFANSDIVSLARAWKPVGELSYSTNTERELSNRIFLP